MRPSLLWLLPAAGAAGLAFWALQPTPSPEPAITAVETLETKAPAAAPGPRVVPQRPTAVPDDAWRDLDGGLRVADVRVGVGEPPAAGVIVSVDYALWTREGALVDSTWSRADPFRFVLGAAQTLPGIERGLAGMTVGGRRVIQIPADLGFLGPPSPTTPRGDLTVEIELLAATPPRVPPTTPAAVSSWQDAGEGLRTADLQQGAGTAAAHGDVVRVDLSEWKADGTLIDSTLRRGQPLQIRLGDHRLSVGVERAIVGMKPGARRAVDVPAALGLHGATESVRADVILVEVVPPVTP